MSTTKPPKPPKPTKFFRVATEGATTDGRTISREWITQMARNFNPQKYGARVWLEHYRGVHPESTFRAYGDVRAVEAREVDGGKLALFASIEPLPELIALTKARQKIYTSIEVTPKFADSGEAYLTGLAVTDSPASLGTDVLAFAQQKPEASPFAGRKSHADALFSEAIEADLGLASDEGDDTAGDGLIARFSERIKSIVDAASGRARTDDARFTQLAEGLEGVADAVREQLQAFATAQHKQAGQVTALQTQLTTLQQAMESTRAQHHTQRPHATGAQAAEQTDC